MKIINSRQHSAIDYIVVIFLLLAPTLFHLNDFISTLTYLLGVVHLTLTVFTNFQYGLIKIIPLKIHGLIELIAAIVLMASPHILSSYEDSITDQFFFATFGVVVLITWWATDYSVS
jgi:hypothetical protein